MIWLEAWVIVGAFAWIGELITCWLIGDRLPWKLLPLALVAGPAAPFLLVRN